MIHLLLQIPDKFFFPVLDQEEAWTRVSVLTLKTNVAMLDLDIERQVLKGARERIMFLYKLLSYVISNDFFFNNLHHHSIMLKFIIDHKIC